MGRRPLACERRKAAVHVRGELLGERRDEEWSPQARNYRLNLSRATLLAMLDARNAKSTRKGRVVWVRAQEAGIHFERRDSRNPSLTRLVEQAAALRSTAIEFVHPDACSCRNGERPLEPQLPGTGR